MIDSAWKQETTATTQGHLPWFYSTHQEKLPDKIIYCFPHAGGNAESYLSWQQELPKNICIKAVCIPGSWRRYKEPSPYSIDILTTELAAEIDKVAADDFYFFGHSMGAIVAYEVARKLKNHAKGLIVSASASPQNVPSERDLAMSKMSDEKFASEMHFFNGIDEKILDSQFSAEIVSARLKKDFHLIAKYRYQETEKIKTPIWGIVGKDDPHVSQEAIMEWQLLTHEFKGCQVADGDHFYLNKNRLEIIKSINEMVINNNEENQLLII
ncbi:thioesterase II family protein [Xenorhabdus bovienii]|uniref:thioesterase II family protein n=1 Tax=Xenorhabdus bovienii TaxID=40576 RepID=UPI003DA4969D